MRASDVLLYENPYGMENPRPRHRRHRRNPGWKALQTRTGKAMFGGLDIMELLGAVGGFVFSAMVPGYILKPTGTETEATMSQWKKGGKVAIALAFAFVAKVALERWKPGVGKAAMYGGFAGTGALALKTYAPSVNVINAPARVPQRVMAPILPQPSNLGRTTTEEFVPASIL